MEELREYQMVAIQKMKTNFIHVQQCKEEVDHTYIGEIIDPNEILKVVMKCYFDVIHSQSKEEVDSILSFFEKFALEQEQRYFEYLVPFVLNL